MEGRKMETGCEDCQRPYGHEHGFPDLIIPFWAWKRISTHGNDAGLLCPSCICKRLHEKGITCEGAFTSGPITSISYHAMQLHRRIENIELAIEGRNNHWARIRELVEYAKGDEPSADHILTEAQAITDADTDDCDYELSAALKQISPERLEELLREELPGCR